MFYNPSQLLSPIATVLVVLYTGSLTGIAQNNSDKTELFSREIYPLLKKRCFKCHGEGEKLKGGLRITNREDLLRGGDLGPAFSLEEPDDSLILKMISYDDDDHKMPPKSKLPAAESDLLRRWINTGAVYDSKLEIAGKASERKKKKHITDADREYWAYRPVKEIKVATDKNAIDALLDIRLKEAGLEPNGIASRHTLIRRASYDLTGLPPTPEEVSKFVNDPRPSQEAWAALIDDYLGRRQYGEKWGRHWLDLVRYAESNGFERDNNKPEIWRYRDYVVDAFNADKPYDQFIIEQLAGDEIAKPTQESLTATGFHRLMQWDDEPADRTQHIYDVLADNVQITSEAFLGSTFGCARCHDHKADPFTQKDYYAFMAFFAGVSHYKTPGTIVMIADPREKQEFESKKQSKLKALLAKQESLETEILTYLEKENLTSKARPSNAKTLIDDARGKGSTWEYTFGKPTPEDWKEVGFRDKSWLKGSAGFGTKGTPGAIVGTVWKTKDIWMRSSFGLKNIPTALVLDINHDEDVEVYLNGQLIFSEKGYLNKYQTRVLDKKALEALQTGRNVLAVHCTQNGGGQYIDLALRTGVSGKTTFTDITRSQGKSLPHVLAKHFGRPIWKEHQDTLKAIQMTRTSQAGTAINAVTEHGPTAPDMHIHMRGSAHALGEKVDPGFTAVLSGTDDPKPASFAPVTRNGKTSSGRRLALANWIASPDNPLTSRVIVNRLWQHHFGRGIVASSSDFGKLGESPTHPEIIDWLAGELVNQKWSLKSIHRTIMTSIAYQRSSAPNKNNLVSDPQNNMYWRHDMRRLTAEEIRDSILAVNGKLNLASGGRWVYPPLPEAVLATASKPGAQWPVSKDPADHVRRSLYLHVKRSLRHPMMAEFDQADTDTACAVRFATTVPNQALTMMNGEFVNNQAADFAAHLRAGSSNDIRSQIQTALYLVTQRPPKPDEIDHCEAFYKRLQSEQGLSPDQALERIALLALNLNEFIYLD